jgi:hypothetical protein
VDAHTAGSDAWCNGPHNANPDAPPGLATMSRDFVRRAGVLSVNLLVYELEYGNASDAK